MTIYRLLIAAVLSVACAGNASAMTGAELQKTCRNINSGPRFGEPDQDAYDLTYCMGYLAAALTIAASRSGVCVPDGVNNGIMDRVVTTYLSRHPKKLHQGSMTQIFAAIAEAYPCKQ